MGDGGIDLLGPLAARAQIEMLGAKFTKVHPAAIASRYVLNPDVARQIRDGAPFDVAVTNPWYVDDLIRLGLVAADTHVPFGRVPLAAGAPGGAGRPVRDLGAIRAVLAAAESIAYTGTGTSGRTFLEVADRLGIRDAIAGKLQPLGAGEPVAAAAAGKVGLAIAPLTVVIARPGIVPVAIFPATLGASIEMTVFTRRDPSGDALALHAFLTDGAHDAALAASGMERYLPD